MSVCELKNCKCGNFMLEDKRIIIDPKIIEKTMANKPNEQSGAVSTEEFNDKSIKYTLSKFEYDLYVEEDDVAEKVIRVKRFALPHKGERWKIFENAKIVFVVEGSKLTNKEKEFLRTAEGLTFLISKFKEGIKSFNALKTEIKKVLTLAK